ncbi:dihydroorotase [Eubacteriales bacterium OttesenSCG-928-M02]|nr:dihydroorotase [Eubacteriales bacterium OttesenSCG-928-M02]
MKYLIQNGEVINPIGKEGKLDILLEDGRISAMGEGLPADGAQVVDAAGKLVFPGLIDMHCHLRDPGQEYKEGLESGTKSAAMGGFTQVACMPNTDPVIDSEAIVKELIDRANDLGYAKVHPIATVTKGMKGKEITEFGFLTEAGAVAFSDDGLPVGDAMVMKNALTYALNFDSLIIGHEEEMRLSAGGVMNEGVVSTMLGLPGITRAAEESMIARDIALAEATGGKVHIAHVSTDLGVALIRFAKERGVRITAETCPHYFCLTEEAILGFDTNAKINPPLRTEKDRQAVIQGLVDGTLDAIVTDHAPHHIDDKDVEFENAANGMSGFETALSLTQMYLVEPGHLGWGDVVRRTSLYPARILKLIGGELAEGLPADVVVYDPTYTWMVTAERLYTKGKNTPLLGKKMQGRVYAGFCNGKPTVEDYEVKA